MIKSPLTDSAHRAALTTFRRLPVPWRRQLLRAGSPTWTAGAVVVLRDPGERILLVQSRHNRGWGLPGGLLRRGEEPAAAAVRELHEEIGVRLRPGDLTVGSHNALFEAQSRQVTAVFHATLDATTCAVLHCDGTETVDLGWFTRAELPAGLVRGTRESLDHAFE